MKKLLILFAAFFTLALNFVNHANACSYQINEAIKSGELKKVALASLGDAKILSSSISGFSFFESKPTARHSDELTYKTKVAIPNLSDSKVLSSSVSGFSFVKNKPTPMCPEELTYKAAVSASYEFGLNTCTVELSVKKLESLGDSDQNTYIVTGSKNARCKKK